jgi:hypothetical protein
MDGIKPSLGRPILQERAIGKGIFYKETFKFSAICFMYVTSLLFFLTWIIAFFNGYSVTIPINSFHEAGIEGFMVIFFAIYMSVMVFISTKSYMNIVRKTSW